ncbi:MAG: ATP-binding protein [Leptolyngbyaceae cyanobacterium MAG.088]|nr:ATP-binding protein [Leptolyngbyaceae cyanobacterium MAG.088]
MGVRIPTGDLPANPFVAGPMITDPRLFVGRKRELARLAGLMQQPVSANVIGERRIGKSSLLYHIYQTWESRVNEPTRYCVVYLNLQEAQCDQEARFYTAVLQALRQELRSHPVLSQLPTTADRVEFAAVIRQCCQENIRPVLCLDEFEALFDHTQSFDDGFFNNLRGLMNANQVMLILASKKSLDVYKRKHGLTSDFFNLGQILKLWELEPDEVTELLLLSKSRILVIGQPKKPGI